MAESIVHLFVMREKYFWLAEKYDLFIVYLCKRMD